MGQNTILPGRLLPSGNQTSRMQRHSGYQSPNPTQLSRGYLVYEISAGDYSILPGTSHLPLTNPTGFHSTLVPCSYLRNSDTRCGEILGCGLDLPEIAMAQLSSGNGTRWRHSHISSRGRQIPAAMDSWCDYFVPARSEPMPPIDPRLVRFFCSKGCFMCLATMARSNVLRAGPAMEHMDRRVKKIPIQAAPTQS